MVRGNITKISNGSMQEIARQEHVSFAKTMQSNAAQKVSEHSTDGVVFGDPEKSVVKEDLVDLVVGLFFDGTGNNRKNIDNREASNSIYKNKSGWKWKWQDNTSYENDRTNVDHLEKMYKKETLYYSIYIEGIGTTNDEFDTVVDMGTGMGSTGIRAKVRACCEALLKTIKSATNKNINQLTVDVFGFSRGAAAARNFVHEITKPAYKATVREEGILTDSDGYMVSQEDLPARGHFGLKMQKKLKINFVKIRFAGLYDTVSAYGIKHRDDVDQLKLNAINKASNIVHLTAADEHREKFELTSVTTGIELSLPGVHSDIGGSYRDNIVENVSLAEELFTINNWREKVAAEKARLIEQGWYRDNQMTNKQPYKLIGNRLLSNKYSLIPLHLMFEMGKPICKFLDTQIKSNLYKIPEKPLAGNKVILSDVYTRLKAYAILKTKPAMLFNNARQLRSIKDMVDRGLYPQDKYQQTVEDAKVLYDLRNRYLHFSSSWDGIGKEPAINKQGERERVVFNRR